MVHDYVPQNSIQFNAFMKKIIEYTEGRMHKWTNIPEARLIALKNARITFDEALQASAQMHTKGNTLAKNEAQAAATHELRGFVNQYLRFDPITNADRANMDIPNHDTIRTEHVDVVETVDFSLKLRNIREVLIDFSVKDSLSKAKPTGYDGAVIIWDVLDVPPTRPDDLKRHTMASRTPHTLDFDDTERGKHVYVTLAWQNERGNRGKWSEIQTAVIP